MNKRLVTAAMVVMLVLGFIFWSAAADYPTKPIRIVCPYAAGGSLDVVSRAFASAAEKYLGQVLVVVNKPGALGMIGELEGGRAKPDGYTMTTRATSSVSTMEWEKINGRNPGYVLDDFINLGTFTLDPTLVVVPYRQPLEHSG